MNKNLAELTGINGMCNMIVTKTITPYQPIIDLFNTWGHYYFYTSNFDPYCMRYQGMERTCWDTDWSELGRTIVSRINTIKRPSVSEFKFMKRIKYMPFPFSKNYYQTPNCLFWNIKQKYSIIHPEASFKLMQQLFKAHSMHDELKEEIYETRISDMLFYGEKKGKFKVKDPKMRKRFCLDTAKEVDYGIFGGGTV